MIDQRRLRFELGQIKRPKTLRCEWCRARFKLPDRGRLPRFCSHTCRQRAYEKRKWGRPRAVEALAQDIAEGRLQGYVRSEIRRMLELAGVRLPPDDPPGGRPGRKFTWVPGGRAGTGDGADG
jgi:hypothetical protein